MALLNWASGGIPPNHHPQGTQEEGEIRYFKATTTPDQHPPEST